MFASKSCSFIDEMLVCGGPRFRAVESAMKAPRMYVVSESIVKELLRKDYYEEEGIYEEVKLLWNY